MDSVKAKVALQQMNWMCDNKDDTADVCFEFDEAGQLKRISAHKIVLAAASPVFKAMFYGDLKEEGDVKIVDASSEVFEVFIQAIYNKNEHITMENIANVMRLADKYDCKGVMQVCASLLSDDINADNVCWVLNLALSYRLHSLEHSCEEMILGEWQNIVQLDTFAQVDRSIVLYILKRTQRVADAKIIFDSCMRWAKKKCEEKMIETEPGNLRAELGPCFVYIKFKQMSMSYFLSIERRFPFFSLNEYRDIVNAINGKAYAPVELKTNKQRIKVDDLSSSDDDFTLELPTEPLNDNAFTHSVLSDNSESTLSDLSDPRELSINYLSDDMIIDENL